MQKKILLFSTLLFTGCNTSDIQSITTAALSKNPTAAFQSIARKKTTQYTVNPHRFLLVRIILEVGMF